METRSSLRNTHTSGYCTVIDNHIIRWQPLSIEDYFRYDNLAKTGSVVHAVLEDEIFRKCVLTQEYVRDLDNLPFGLVSTVAQNIMEHSGPLSIDHFNNTLEHNRGVAQEPIHHLITLIVRAFPAYKPEDVYAMSFDTFMLRLAQAESLLLMLNVIGEPIELIDENSPPPKRGRGRGSNKGRTSSPELRAIWEKQQQEIEKKRQVNVPQQPKKKETEKPSKGVKFDKVFQDPNKSPIFNKDKSHPEYMNLGSLDHDRIKTEQTVGTEEESAERAKMVREAANIYKDVLGKLEFYKKPPQKK